MSKNKKIIIIGSGAFIISLILTIILCTFTIKANYASKFINDMADLVIKQLKNENISGTAKFELDVYSSMNEETQIIKDAKYTANYQLHLKDGFSTVELNGDYKEDKIKSNIYTDTDQIYITLEEIYDKNILYNNKNLKYFTAANDTSKLLKIFIKELNKTAKNSNYLFETEEINDKKVNKITLDITKEKNPELRKKLINNLIENKKFIEALSNIERDTSKIIKSKFKNEYLNNYKLVLYTSKTNKEFIKAEIKINEIDLKITKKNNKYHYEYYIRDGLEYNGYVEIRNKEIKKININNNIYHYVIDIRIDELNIKYNTKLEIIGRSRLKEEVVADAELEKEKDNILKNDIINSIYDNYMNRYPKPQKEVIEKIEEPKPTPPVEQKEEDINREVINGIG